jgi:hypothetical protein
VRQVALVGAILLATAACTSPGPAVAPAPRPTLLMPTGSPSPLQAHLRAQAVTALERWEAVATAADRVTVIAYGGPALPEWSGSVGEWEPALRENAELAATSGKVFAATALPISSPPPGVVVWPDGSRREVGVVSAADALRDVRAGKVDECAKCVPLRITGARLGTARLDTVRGEATAPAWEFTVEGSTARLTRIAIAPADLHPISPLVTTTRGPPQVRQATVDATGRRLTSRFVGGHATGDRPCDADYTSEVAESAHAVVVIVYADIQAVRGTSGSSRGAIICETTDHEYTITNTLATPLGDRAVIELSQGIPVPLARG